MIQLEMIEEDMVFSLASSIIKNVLEHCLNDRKILGEELADVYYKVNKERFEKICKKEGYEVFWRFVAIDNIPTYECTIEGGVTGDCLPIVAKIVVTSSVKGNEVKDNIIDWFRNEFVPSASDETIAALIHLYKRFGDELLKDEVSKQFVKDLADEYKNTPVQRR